MSNIFLNKCVKVPASQNFWILSRCLVNGPQAPYVNSGYFRYNSCIYLSQVNKNLSMNLFILNWSFQILLKLWGSLFLIKVDFFLPQTAQKHLSSLFSFVTLKLSFAVYFLQLVQYFSIVFIYIPQNFIFLLFISLYSFNALFTETNSS